MPRYKFTPEDLHKANLSRQGKMKPLVDRFEEKIERIPESGCWIWMGAPTSRNYGLMSINGQRVLSHRVAYELYRGPIPHGLNIDHLCKVTMCVNPDHLEAVTQGENVKRGNAGNEQRMKTHCPQGHPYEGDNLRIYRGMRYCNTCLRESGRRRYQERRRRK